MLGSMHDYVSRGGSFVFETTLSGRGYARSIPVWQRLGFGVKITFIRLANPDLAVSRVRQRVSEGGHDVPEDLVRRRFHSGWDNFRLIDRDLVDKWEVYDNSGDVPMLMDSGGQQ